MPCWAPTTSSPSSRLPTTRLRPISQLISVRAEQSTLPPCRRSLPPSYARNSKAPSRWGGPKNEREGGRGMLYVAFVKNTPGTVLGNVDIMAKSRKWWNEGDRPAAGDEERVKRGGRQRELARGGEAKHATAQAGG